MAELQFRDITEDFGSEVSGVDPSGPLDEATVRALREAFDRRSVLLFRDVTISEAQQGAFCRLLIDDRTPGRSPDMPAYVVSNKEEGGYAPHGRLLFHGDSMWSPYPAFQALSLHALEVQPDSATTSLASNVRALAALPADLRRRVEEMEVVHITGSVYRRGNGDLLEAQRSNDQSNTKSALTTHPRTGEPVLYVSQQTTDRVVGLDEEESEALLQELFSYLYAPEHVYEHQWRNGDLLIFDNISMQHGRGYVDGKGGTRTLQKAIAPLPAIRGERPTFAKAS